MSEHLPVSYPLRVADLATRKPTRFDLAPNEADCALIAALIGITGLRKLRLKGELRPAGKHDFTLEAQLGATVVQPCVVSLTPVSTRIDEHVLRRYINGLDQPEADEIEIPEDDSIEPLPDVIDVGAVLLEALALALPPYPRAKGVDLGEAVFAAPGTTPLRTEDLRPFAGLAGLRDKLADPSGADGSGGENDAG